MLIIIILKNESCFKKLKIKIYLYYELFVCYFSFNHYLCNFSFCKLFGKVNFVALIYLKCF